MVEQRSGLDDALFPRPEIASSLLRRGQLRGEQEGGRRAPEPAGVEGRGRRSTWPARARCDLFRDDPVRWLEDGRGTKQVAVVHSVKIVSSSRASFPARPDSPAAHADFNLDGRTTLDVAGCR